MKSNKLLSIYIFALLVILSSCNQDRAVNAQLNNELDSNIPPIPVQINGPFTVEGANLLKDGKIVNYKGVNSMQTFGLDNAELMSEWNIQIVREFVGNLREQPIDGDPILASDGVWYHPLQDIVDQNRANNMITILCPFGWVNNSGKQTLFTGLNPSSQPFFDSYKIKMKKIADHFKDQPDVWIQLWNEPYHWNNENSYSHKLWLSDMEEMVDNLRWVDGFHNIIIVPGNEQGQSEDAVVAKGSELMERRFNLLFSLHAYEKWLVSKSKDQIVSRIESITDKNIPFIIGEVGVQNVGKVMEIEPFLNAAESTNITVLAWLWDKNTEYNNALLKDDGQPNSKEINNYWGSIYKSFMDD
jgi:mannan endo-1,4-beta-mannosidase